MLLGISDFNLVHTLYTYGPSYQHKQELQGQPGGINATWPVPKQVANFVALLDNSLAI